MADFTREEVYEIAETSGKLVRADLAGLDLSCSNYDPDPPSLAGINLSGAYLRGAHLRYVNLTGADLAETNLIEGNLFGVDLRAANLSKADLSGAVCLANTV
jgi:uncharacterized protein YjbI with pentapeptide repeats